MLKKSVTYVNFNDEKKVKDLYFNLSKTEIIDMVARDRLDPEDFERAAKEENPKELFQMIIWLVEVSYGEKSSDGEFFDKSFERFSRFKASAAYDALIMTITSSEKEALDFFKGIFPKDLVNAALKDISSKNNSIGVTPLLPDESSQNITPIFDSESSEPDQKSSTVPITREEYNALMARLEGASNVVLNSDHIGTV